MDEAVRSYIDGIAPESRPLFDRLHRLILVAYPDADVVLSYGIPTYQVGKRRLYVVNPKGLETLEKFLASLWPSGLRKLKKAVESHRDR